MATLLSRRSGPVGLALTALAALIIGCGGGGGGGNNSTTTTGTTGTTGTSGTSSSTSGAAGSIGGGTDGGTGALAANSIYYIVNGANSGYDVKVTKEDGTGTGTYATGLSADSPVASPDPSSSGRLVFAASITTNGALGIYRNTSASTTGATTIVTPRYSEVDSLMVSRDGKKVVYVAATSGGNPQLYVVATTGSGTPTLLDGDEIVAADLSSTGNIVVYEKLPSTGSTTLFARDLTATNPIQLTQSDGRDRDEPQLSKDGSKVAFSQDDGTGRHTLATLSAVGGAITTIDPFPGTTVSVRAPSFSGDGTRLVFVAEGDSTTNTGLFTCDLNGANLIQVPNTVAPLPLRSLYWTNAGGRAAGQGLSLHLNRPRAKGH